MKKFVPVHVQFTVCICDENARSQFDTTVCNILFLSKLEKPSFSHHKMVLYIGAHASIRIDLQGSISIDMSHM